MIELNLPDMSCGHCASTVMKTCKLVDPVAKIEVDLHSRWSRSNRRKTGRTSPTRWGKPATRQPSDTGALVMHLGICRPFR